MGITELFNGGGIDSECISLVLLSDQDRCQSLAPMGMCEYMTDGDVRIYDRKADNFHLRRVGIMESLYPACFGAVASL
jgi:hypothetical protein